MMEKKLMSTPTKPDSRPDENQDSDQESTSKRSALLQAAKYSHVALALPAATFVGWLLGTMMDRWLHTGWIYILGLVLGIVAGFVELARAAITASRE
jgi:F0F1-type ATP synthase assembly protein I